MRTIAIRVEDELHEQLTLLSRLAGRPLSDELREALDTHIERKRSEVDLTEQAQLALDEIERNADQRRKAIKSLLGKSTPAKPAKRGSQPQE